MSGSKKIVLIVLGALSAILIVAQFVLGLLSKYGDSPTLLKTHEHLGYTAVVVILIYLFLSLATVAALPTTRRQP